MFSSLYFWPSYILPCIFVLCTFLFLLSINVVLGLAVISLYGLTPKRLLFENIGRMLKSSDTEKNIQQTFQLHLDYRPPTCIYVWSPHGLFSLSSVMFNSFQIAKHPTYMPTKIVSISLFHYFPVINDMLSYLNNIPSDYQTIKRTLETGNSISIMLGGIREMMDIEPYKIKLYIKKRKGVFKIALETGKPIIPVLTYGENELFEPFKNSYTELFNNFVHSITGIAFPFVTPQSMYKWYQLSYKPLDTIHSHVGKPVYARKDDTIETLRNRYISSIKKLFRDTAPPKYTLHIE